MSFNLSHDQVRTLERVSTIISWSGAGASLFVVVTFAVFPKKRKFPFRLTTWFSLCAALVSFSVAMGTFVDYRQSDPYTLDESRWNHVVCIAQAVTLQYFGVALLLWWLILAFNLWSMVTHGFDYAPGYEKYYHLIAWLLPLVQTLTPLLLGHMGPAGLYCWIEPSNHGIYEFSFFYVPMGIYLLLGLFFWPPVIRSFYLTAKRNKKANGGGGGPSTRVAESNAEKFTTRDAGASSSSMQGDKVKPVIYLRPILFVVLFFVIFALMFAQRLHQATATVQSVPLVYIHEISVAGVGLWCFIMFGLTRDNFSCWRQAVAWLLNRLRAPKTYDQHDPRRPLTLKV